MLASLLNRKPTKITFEKLIHSKNDEINILTDPYEIENKVINHFQSAGNVNNTEKINMTDQENIIYYLFRPKENIDYTWFNPLNSCLISRINRYLQVVMKYKAHGP